MTLLPYNGIYHNITIGISPTLHIRGILAKRYITHGSLIEICPVILYPNTQEGNINKTKLGNYVFRWDDTYDCVVLGYGELYNHSYTPNAFYRRNYKDLVMEFIAYTDIKPKEEICINYNGDPASKDPIDPDYFKDIL